MAANPFRKGAVVRFRHCEAPTCQCRACVVPAGSLGRVTEGGKWTNLCVEFKLDEVLCREVVFHNDTAGAHLEVVHAGGSPAHSGLHTP